MHAAGDASGPPAGVIDTEELPGVPRQGIGRGMKVGKEELVGIIRALELFVEEDHEARKAEWRARAERIAGELAEEPALSTSVTAAEKTDVAPTNSTRPALRSIRCACPTSTSSTSSNVSVRGFEDHS